MQKIEKFMVKDSKADRTKAENKRRIELGMLQLLLETYPNEAREKLRKLATSERTGGEIRFQKAELEKSLVLRE